MRSSSLNCVSSRNGSSHWNDAFTTSLIALVPSRKTSSFLCCHRLVADRRKRGRRRNDLGIKPAMNDRRLARRHGALERAGEFLGRFYIFAMPAIRLRQRGEIGILQHGGGDAPRIFALLMHADGTVHAVVEQDDDDRQIVLNGSGELLPGHLEIAVAGKCNDRSLAIQPLCRDRRRNAITHRAGCRRKLSAEAPVGPEAMQPGRKVARAVAEDSVWIA